MSAEPTRGPVYSEEMGDACLEFTITNYVGTDKEQLTFQLEFDGDAPNAESLQQFEATLTNAAAQIQENYQDADFLNREKLVLLRELESTMAEVDEFLADPRVKATFGETMLEQHKAALLNTQSAMQLSEVDQIKGALTVNKEFYRYFLNLYNM